MARPRSANGISRRRKLAHQSRGRRVSTLCDVCGYASKSIGAPGSQLASSNHQRFCWLRLTALALHCAARGQAGHDAVQTTLIARTMTFAMIAVFNRSHGSWARSMHVAVVGPEVETHRHPVTAAGCRCGKLQNRHRRGFASAKLGSRLRSLGESSGTSCAARREIVEAMRSQPDVHACTLTERRACAAVGHGRRCTAAVVVAGAGAGVCVRPGHRCAGARPRRCRC